MTELAVREKGSKIVGIGGEATFASRCDVNLATPTCLSRLAALVIPAQRAIEALARKLGLDPDPSVSLRKVTQTN